MKDKKQKKKKVLQWHPAFFADVKIELEEEADKLLFENEHQLGTKPKEIDVLIIKKEGTEPIRKNIGRIFRRYNIIEYKAPEDYLSIDDFYKVYGYACFYKADTEKHNQIDITDITITLVSHGYPRKLIKHLKYVRHCRMEKADDGIYYIRGVFIPIQIIVTSRLSKEKNFWLRNLTNKIEDEATAQEIVEKYTDNQNNKLYRSVMNIIIHANEERFGERNMCEALEELWGEYFEKKYEKKYEEKFEKEYEEKFEREYEEKFQKDFEEKGAVLIKQQTENCLLCSIKNLMETMKMSAEQAMTALKVAKEEQDRYAAMLLTDSKVSC